jgi:phosphate transport system substrate-binding protein
MTKRSGPPPILYILMFLALAAGAYWLFFRNPKTASVTLPPQAEAPVAANPQGTAPAPANFSPPANVPAGTVVTIDGSTSMVLINEALKAGFQQQYPGTVVNTNAAGSDNGIQALLGGSADVAAVSRPLTAQEQAQGLVAVPVAADAIALVVGNNNPFQRGISSTQVGQIFTGSIDNWATLGGPAAPIRVINRPPVSGTAQAFQSMALGGQAFGTGTNVTTLDRDATTPMLQQLGPDGIGYATFEQVADQQTVRIVPIDGLTPEAPTYTFKRSLYYVYGDASNPAVQAFLGYASSPQGQQAIASATSGN